jgi:hypothetical protein
MASAVSGSDVEREPKQKDRPKAVSRQPCYKHLALMT